MINEIDINVLKKKILAVRTGSTKKHYKVSIGEICDVMMLLLEQIEILRQPSMTFTTLDDTVNRKTVLKPYEGNDSNQVPEITGDIE